jgi:ketosteroid isomerase-like protein
VTVIDPAPESFDDLRFAQQEVVESGDRVMVRTRVTGRGRESGIDTDTEFSSVFRIAEGRIATQAA